MKGLNVRKLAAIATGAALLGTAAAPLVGAISVAKGDLYNTDGTPKVNIVVGSKAAVSDGVWAGNLAAKIAEKAGATNKVVTSLAGADGSDASASVDLSDLTVDVTIGGGSVSFGSGSKDYKVTLSSGSGGVEVVSNNDTNALTDSQLPHLFNESVTEKVNNGDQVSQSNSLTVTERIGVKVDAKFDQSSDVKDIAAYIEPNNFYYEVTLGSSGIDLGSTSFTDGTDDNVKVIMFGEEYELSTASIGATGTKNIKLVKSSAKESYNEGDTIEGLVGDHSLVGKEVSVKVVQVVATGTAVSTYSATFQLLDSEGNLIDTRTVTTGENLRDVFQDSDGDNALSSNLFIDTIATGATTGIGYVEVTKGTDTLLLYDTKGYPYDSTDTTGIYDYVVTLSANDTNNLYKIKVANSRDKWNTSSTSNGVLYPTTPGQSLTGKTGESAVFGEALLDGTLGKGYAKVDFVGWENTQERTSVWFSKDLADHGALKYRGANDAEHTVPYALELSQDTSGSTFSFDSKTIWYTEGFGADSSPSVANDYNVTVATGDVVNGRAWTITTGDSPLLPNPYAHITNSAADVNISDTNTFSIDGVTYTVQDSNSASNTVIVSVDGYVGFRKENSTGSLIYNTSGDSTDQSYGKLLFSQNKVFDANGTANVALIGNDDKAVSYAVYPYSTGSRLWLLLDADQIGDAAAASRSADLIQNSKVLAFRGTSYPNTTAYTEATLSDANAAAFIAGSSSNGVAGAAPGQINGPTTSFAGYFVPQDPDFNATSGPNGATGNAYYVAEFQVDDALSGNVFKVYVNTANGSLLGPYPNTSNLTGYSSSVDFNATNVISLKTGDNSSNLHGMYNDFGTKAWLDGDNTATVSMPEARENVQIVVYGSEVKKEIQGGETVTLASGETKETSSGVKVTLTNVAGGACDVSSGSGTSVCKATPDTYVSPVAINRPLVFVDSDPTPSGTNIVVGGQIVNRLASSLADRLTAAGQMVAEVDAATGTIYVAGYTADDTGRAVQELIDAIDALQ